MKNEIKFLNLVLKLPFIFQKHKSNKSNRIMLEKQHNRPQTSKYRNQSHFQFGDQNCFQLDNQNNSGLIKKKRPQSYRNISKIGQYMSDEYIVPTKQTQKVRYINAIQNTDKSYDVLKRLSMANPQKSHQFQDFLQTNGNRMYKPIDQFTEYTDLMKRNFMLLRRGQFNTPLGKEQFSMFKRSQNFTNISQETSKYYTNFKQSKYSKLGNSIGSSLCQSIRQKKNIRRQKEEFHHRIQKQIKPLNKTLIGHAKQYSELLHKQRQNSDQKTLNNAMSRVLTLQAMKKKIQNLTQMYV